jgi:hypothetical protein
VLRYRYSGDPVSAPALGRSVIQDGDVLEVEEPINHPNFTLLEDEKSLKAEEGRSESKSSPAKEK